MVERDLEKAHGLSFENLERVRKALEEGKKVQCMYCGEPITEATPVPSGDATAMCKCAVDCVLTEDDAPIGDAEWCEAFKAKYWGDPQGQPTYRPYGQVLTVYDGKAGPKLVQDLLSQARDLTGIRMLLTNDSLMGSPGPTAYGEWADLLGETLAKVGAAEEYLKADPRHAVVLENNNSQIAVWRGASEKEDNFFWQLIPLENPGDSVESGSAMNALTEALEEISR